MTRGTTSREESSRVGCDSGAGNEVEAATKITTAIVVDQACVRFCICIDGKDICSCIVLYRGACPAFLSVENGLEVRSADAAVWYAISHHPYTLTLPEQPLE